MAQTLRLGQYDMDGFVFGTRTPFAVPSDFLVNDFQIDEGAIDDVDDVMPFEDGTIFGVDTRSGQNITFKVYLWKKGQPALDDLTRMRTAWRGDSVRFRSGLVTTLRMNKQGRTRLVYGRPRRFAPTFGRMELGWGEVDCDFKCVDENFYDDVQRELDLEMGALPTAGLVAGFTLPATISQFAPAAGTFVIEGNNPTWPTFIIYGPVINPEITIINHYTIKLNVNLNHTETISIDPRPWRRLTFKTSAGLTYNQSGRYTVDSPTMREMSLPPGVHNMTYRGIDETLSSHVTIGWRNAYSTP